MGSRSSYERVIRKNSHGMMRGFKLNPRKFSVQRLRVKLLHLFRSVFSRWSYGNISSINSTSSGNKVRKQADYAMYGGRNDYKLKSNYSRSNSFYAEAIADCLDFIKRNSLSLEKENRDASKLTI
ncbi:hypothetical protein HAX54_030444 [Datura stramonium]|uniref:Uncharacterized protein n=1 Tax=Datura stramonium TaxID=4076 RepID=A0ABS8V7P9_DATST|nr:hypothetical protein [Datura stramonium]